MHFVELSQSGRRIQVPAVSVAGLTVVRRGRFPRIASILDEEFVDRGATADIDAFVDSVAASDIAADLLSFAAHSLHATLHSAVHFEWDNVALATTADFDEWWASLPQATRKNCRRAERRGVSLHLAELDDALVASIKALYDEAPVRQGRRFWHYGKDVQTIKSENSSYLDKSRFIVAMHEGRLIGFLKMVYVGPEARIMQVLCSNAHQDKRPMNAIISKAVETCSLDGIKGLVYSKFQYGNKTDDPLIEFKRRCGFEKVLFPRYFVPLTASGRLALSLGLHRNLIDVVPASMLRRALRLRHFLSVRQWRSTGDDVAPATAD